MINNKLIQLVFEKTIQGEFISQFNDEEINIKTDIISKIGVKPNKVIIFTQKDSSENNENNDYSAYIYLNNDIQPVILDEEKAEIDLQGFGLIENLYLLIINSNINKVILTILYD